MNTKDFSTEFNDTLGEGEVSLYPNPFNNGAKFYGKFNRTKVDTMTLISRLGKNGSGKNLIATKETLTLIKKEVMDALSDGETVEFIGLGTFYIAPVGGFSGTSDDTSDQKFTVKFTPSAELRSCVKDLKIKKAEVKDTSPTIENITDQYTGKNFGEQEFALTAGKNIVVTGKRLKIMGENDGVYLAPVDAQDAVVSDEGQWLKSNRIARNLPKTIDFYLPDGVKAGTKYRIVIRTSYCNGNTVRKTHTDIVSGIVTAKAA